MKKKLHVVYKTHLDIGFTDLAENVITQYLEDFIPRAMDLGEQLPDKFTWTTGSWLIDFYLNHESVSEANKSRMRACIEQGTIRWHGLPYTIHTELMDGELTRHALSVSKKLDQEFNKETIASKMTDIPGHTISLVPYLQEAGIEYLHIGVNASSAIPKVPKIFLWKAKDGSEVIVHYAMDYGEVFDNKDWPDALYFAHSHDNMGPPADAEEVEELFETLALEYPDYEIIPSSLDAFARGILPFKETLPVIEEEIADTWIHGIAADPKKISEFKTLLRLRNKWLKDNRISRDSKEYRQFSDNLLLVAEHTWGANGNVYLPEYRHFALEDFETARKRDLVTFNHDRGTMDFADLMSYISTDIDWKGMEDKRRYSVYEASWQEQREYVNDAIDSLPEDLKQEAREALIKEAIKEIATNETKVIPGRRYDFKDITLSFSQTGGIDYLSIGDQQVIIPGREFGGLSYERFDFNDYSKFFSQYSRLTRWTTGWAMGDFGRRGIEACPEIRYEKIKPFMENSQIDVTDTQVIFTLDVTYQPHEIRQWGLPKKNRLVYVLDLIEGKLDLTYDWEGKQANRMPESYWLETSIQVANPSRWQMEKLDLLVDPLDVIQNGNRNLHALTEGGMVYRGYEGQYQLQSFDAPLMSLGRRSLLKFDNQLPDLGKGLFVNLFNNVWGTNFAAWYEGDMSYHVRFNWKMNPFKTN
ncbi:MAG: DUF5054 domain-containing protein [Vagococcus sp.]|uniref:DUF5054 domain-containing protein n=1 Tax=Vagococcus TaxID=2737 RepID=UPI002FC947C1